MHVFTVIKKMDGVILWPFEIYIYIYGVRGGGGGKDRDRWCYNTNRYERGVNLRLGVTFCEQLSDRKPSLK